MAKTEDNFEISYDIQEHGKEADTEVTQNTLILFIWSVANKQWVMGWPVVTKVWSKGMSNGGYGQELSFMSECKKIF